MQVQSADNGSRASAQHMLRDRITRSERFTKGLQIIYDKLPWDELTKEEEEILWPLFCEVWR